METKLTKRPDDAKKKLENRLKIIEGQVRGISEMIKTDRYCRDILIQISAINKSLKSIANIILEDHVKNCIVRDLKADKLEVIPELLDLIRKME